MHDDRILWYTPTKDANTLDCTRCPVDIRFSLHFTPSPASADVNKKPTKWWPVGLGKTSRHSILQSRHTLNEIQCVITCDLRQTVTELHLYAGHTRLRTFVQYLTAFHSRWEAASDVTSGKFVKLAVPNKRVKIL